MAHGQKMDERPGEIPTTVFYTQYNRQGEIPFRSEKPSMTVPGQSMTVQEILTRHAQGRPVNQDNGMMYGGDEYYPDVKKMDLIDYNQMLDDVEENIKKGKKNLEDIGKQRTNSQRKKAATDVDEVNDKSVADGGTAEKKGGSE